MAGPIRIAILANGRQARQEINQVNGALGGLQKFARRGLAIAGVGGLAALAKSSVDTEREFSLTMRTIQANTNATSTEIDKMAKLAVKAGGEMGFSARESAGAMLELAKAGLETKTIMGGGLAGTLKLAAAGGTDLATASTIAANAMNAFSLAGSDMDKIAAALAGGANASTASVESLGIALSQVGPGATIAGLSLQETVATLAAFDNAGIKGSDSGTSLKTMLTRLVPGTKAAANEMARLNLDFTKADGSFVSLEQIAGRLKTSLGKLSAEERTNALRKIFGSDATRAATVLMREGASGIRKYIDATKDQSAAQKAVNARTSGTEGAIKRLNAAVEKAKLRIGNELAPAVVKGADAFGDKLLPALETGIKAGKDIARALAPAAEEISEALSNLAGEGDSAGRMFNDVFLPALETTAEVVAGLVNFIDELPGPVKEIGLQAGIAALVLPRLAAGFGAVQARATAAGASMLTFTQRIAQNRAAMTYASGVYGKTAAALHGFGGAARNVAGIGGMLLLAQGMQKSDGAAKTLMTTMGGAALGFSVGGPIGAAVGGLGGLMLGLSDGTHRAEASAEQSKTTWQNYATTMDQVTGATTRATKSMIIQDLQQSGLLKSARELGISQSTLVNGVLGQTKASGQLQSALAAEEASIRDAVKAYNEKYDTSIAKATDEAKAVFESIKARKENLDSIRGEVGEVRKATAAERERQLLLRNVPDLAITQIQTPGAVDSKRELAELAAQYKLTPKQIATVIKMNGIDASTKEIRGIAREIEKSGKVKPSDAWKGFFKADLGKAKRDADAGIGGIDDVLRSGLKAKPNIANGPFGRGVSGDLTALISVARGRANTVGSNLGSGMYNGMGPWIGPIAERARSMVAGAVAAANAAGGIRSPSRETMRTGRYLGEGLTVGLRAQQPKARTAGQKLVDAVRAGVVKGTPGVEAALKRITATIEKGITGKNQAAREKALLTRYKAHYTALTKNAKAQDTNTRRLETARDKLKDLTTQYKDYAAAIKTAITGTGDVTQLGRQEDETVSISSLLDELRTKAANARRFSVLLQSLAKDGLSRTSIQQMLDAGPEAALATAEAIAFGGAAAIKEINELQASLAATGSQLGSSMAERYYGAGVDAAKGIVAGLEAEAKTLDRAAVRLANSLVAAVKKALGIRSPSRVFAGIGDNVVKGLDLGIDDTYVQRTGAVAAASLRKGFGTPALEAYAQHRNSAAAAAGGGTFTLRLTAEQLDRLSRGEALQADLDYARANGVRGVTF